jgi:hypothetical protein
MNLLGLNCRRLGLDVVVGKLRDLVRSYNLVVVFLSKTKKKARDMERIRWGLGFISGVAVDCVGDTSKTYLLSQTCLLLFLL